MSEKYILLSLCFCEEIQCWESLNCCHFCAMTSTVGIVYCYLYCAKTSNESKIFIAFTLTLYEAIQYHESLHCYHFCIVTTHPMWGNSTLLSLLNFAKSSNTGKVYIAVTFEFYEDIQCRQSLHWYHLFIVRRHPMS